MEHQHDPVSPQGEEFSAAGLRMLWIRLRETVSISRVRSCQMTSKRLMAALGTVAAVWLTTVTVVGQLRGGPGARAVSRPWPPERLSDGQPDVEGLWSAVNAGSTSLTNPVSGGADFDRRATGVGARVPSRVIQPPDRQLPYQRSAHA